MFNLLKKFLKHKRGMTGLVIALVVALVTIAVAIPVSLWVTSLTFNAIKPDTTWTTSANSSFVTLKNNIWASFNLGSILPIVLVAGAIIAGIVGFMVWKKD